MTSVFRFFLGTHQPSWLPISDVPLFVSRVRLQRYKTMPRARCLWALDSGAFSEIATYGDWTISAPTYCRMVRRYADEIGGLLWAAPMDWMCEPIMVAKTRLSVREHQQRTVQNFLELRAMAPQLPFVPVLQGWSEGEYLDCCELYDKDGVNLQSYAVVGLGSVCRRQGTMRVWNIIDTLYRMGINLHGFGLKTLGLRQTHGLLVSADSMAWSYDARRSPALPGHEQAHKNCANCLEWALSWRSRLLESL